MRSKRWFDVVGAAGGLLFFAPVCLLIAIAILVDDGQPVLFRQDRLGERRRRFTILKFRSMRDGRVTRLGRLLRGTGLDELPQFVNVLRGEMSAVGPRPLVDADVWRLGWTTTQYDVRWSVRPGLTGLAQVIGPRAPRAALFLDRTYVERQNLWLDVRLIALSFVVNALGKQRVRMLLRRRDSRPPRTVGVEHNDQDDRSASPPERPRTARTEDPEHCPRKAATSFMR
jgi:lipopolysaccharide/colanic/teichoic acid biosynthesis glycosyltransferase